MDIKKQFSIFNTLREQLKKVKAPLTNNILELPLSVFTDSDLAKKEWEGLFHGHPQMIGMSADLPCNNSFFTMNDFGIPILATRDDQGRFHTFINTCRHRGAQVVTAPRGEQASFVCPYHHWCYSNKGRLKSYPKQNSFGDVDLCQMGLIELPSKECFGLLWTAANKHVVLDIETNLGAFANEINSWDFEKYHYIGSVNYDIKSNWKLVNDTFGEGYHFSLLHKDTMRSLVGDSYHVEIQGRNSRWDIINNNRNEIMDVTEESFIEQKHMTHIYYIFPNIQLLILRGRIFLFRIYPDIESFSRSRLHVSLYYSDSLLNQKQQAKLNGETIELDKKKIFYPLNRDYYFLPGLESDLHFINEVIIKEDCQMAELIQVSANASPDCFSLLGKNEFLLQHFHDSMRSYLGLSSLEIYNNEAHPD